MTFRLPELVAAVIVAFCAFMLIWEGDAALRECEAAGIQSPETCSLALLP